MERAHVGACFEAGVENEPELAALGSEPMATRHGAGIITLVVSSLAGYCPPYVLELSLTRIRIICVCFCATVF